MSTYESIEPYNTRTDKALLYWWYKTDEEMFGEEIFLIGEELKHRGYIRVATKDDSGEMWYFGPENDFFNSEES